MSGSINRRWLFEKRPEGPVSRHNFRWTQAEVPAPGEGQMLVRNLWLDVAPTNVLSLLSPPEEGIATGGCHPGVRVLAGHRVEDPPVFPR